MPQGQIAATTGRTRRYPWLDIINAQTPYLADQQRLQDSRRLQNQQMAREFIQNRRALASEREQADRMYQLQQEADEAAAKQARTSQILSGVGTGVSAVAPYAGKIYGGVSGLIGGGGAGVGTAAGASAGVGAGAGTAAGTGIGLGGGASAAGTGVGLGGGTTATSGTAGGGIGTGIGAGAGYAALGALDTANYRNMTGREVGSSGFSSDWNLSASLGLPLSGTGLIRKAVGADSDIAKAMDILGGKPVLDPIHEALGINKIAEDVGDWVDDTCIIVSACHGRDSLEVDVARMFRDLFLDPETLRGYYMIAEQVVPVMERFPRYKEYIRRNIVDPIIEFGKSFFNGNSSVTPESVQVTGQFLSMCAVLGGTAESYTRKNGEVF
jgi:hypothetical protein